MFRPIVCLEGECGLDPTAGQWMAVADVGLGPGDSHARDDGVGVPGSVAVAVAGHCGRTEESVTGLSGLRVRSGASTQGYLS